LRRKAEILGFSKTLKNWDVVRRNFARLVVSPHHLNWQRNENARRQYPHINRMRKLILTSLATLTSLIAVTAVKAQSGSYFAAVTNLNPVIYLPLNETTAPPGSKATAINTGSLGAADNGLYHTGSFPGVAGALGGSGDSDTAGLFSGVPGAAMLANYDSAYAGDTAFTVELWVNSPVTDPANYCLVSCMDAASPRNGWLIYDDITGPGTFNFRTYEGNGTTVSDGSSGYTFSPPGGHIVANTWYHVVVTFDGTNAQGYINGVAATNSAVATAYTTSQGGPFSIGARSDNGFNFNGIIDDVSFYSNVLSASTISNHYVAGTSGGGYSAAVLADNPQLYFRLDDAAAPPVAQNYGSAGAAAEGYYQSGTTPGVAGPGFPGFGVNNFAVQFPSGQSADNGPTVIDEGATGLSVGNSSPITFALWAMAANGNTTPGFQTLAGKGDSSYRFDIDPTHPHWNAGNINEITGAATLNDGLWHFWAGTWDGSNVSALYIDGKLVGQNTGNSKAGGSGHVLDIGDAPDYTGRNFGGGTICQLAIFPTALTQSQIQDLYFAAGTPPVLISQPIPAVVLPGSNITFTVSAVGFEPLTYQWYGPEQPGQTPPNGLIAGATNTSLTINGATAGSSGAYYVVVTDANGVSTTNTSPNGTQGGTFLNVITNALSGSYFSKVINLNPLAYWPLNESAPAPAWPAIATNGGSLGTNGDAIYSGQVVYQSGSALADGEGNSIIGDGVTSQVVLPYQSALSTVPLTLEGWFDPGSGFNNGGETLFSDGEPFAANLTGFWVNAGFHGGGNGTADFNLLTYYGAGVKTGANIDVTNIAPSQWYYVAVTIAPNPSSNSPSTGYIATLYVDGTNAGSVISDFVPNADAPFKIGNRSDDPGFGSYNFLGGMSEVAFYPSALSAAHIAAHYAAGTNATPTTPYETLVLNDGPSLFYRLNEQTPSFPSQDTGPVANNYGATGANDNGVYLTGTFPGSVPGPGVEQFPGSDVAVSFNHIYWLPGGPTTAGLFNNGSLGNTGLTGYVDVPLDQFNSLDYQGPVSLAMWLQASPVNNGDRFSTSAGRGDPSYRADVDGTSDDQLHFAYGGAGDQVGTGLAGNINDGVWHFVVGVWDGTNQYLYVDGVSNSASPATGLPTGDDYDFTVGEAPDDAGRTFDGNIAEVAIFAHALTAGDVASLYSTAQVAAEIVDQPITNQTIGAGLNTTITVVATGNPPLSYEWLHNGTNVSGSEFSGANSNVLSITGAALSDAGTYTVVVSNIYGSVTSSPSLLFVLATPIINPPLAPTNYALAGNSLSLEVGVTSFSQVTNAWYFNGTVLTNGNGISGATTTTLNILNVEPANAGTYTYWATNSAGTASSSSQLIVLPFSEPTFNTNGTDWTVNNNGVSTGQGEFLTNDVIQLTDHHGSETTSFFFDVPMYVGAFKASWIYTDVGAGPLGANGTADGYTFTLANNPKGPGALGTEAGGAGGSGLAYVGITNSFALATELYNNGDNAPGLAVATNGEGSTGAGNPNGYNYGPTGNVSLISGDGIKYDLLYNGQTLSVTLTDTNTGATFETNYDDVTVTQDVGGNTALIGFTAATGGVDAIQTIADFTYTPLPILSAAVTGGNLIISWPTGMGLGPFSLQSTPSLSPSSWAPVSDTVNIVNGEYQVNIGPPTGDQFYRLVAP
jgi:hypothetical protein